MRGPTRQPTPVGRIAPAAIRRTEAQASADNAVGVIRPTHAQTCFRRTGSPSCGRQASRVRSLVPAARR
ncbi:hypothetical protein IPC776_12625 [Pseudomonas aeruginosa]|nr:hypothetical protein IPC776_12625 [Pseudomonas aeruginosa]